MTREPEQRKKKCVTFNKEVHYSTDEKPFCSGIRPPGELKSILKKSIHISVDNGRNQDQISLGFSENPHVTTEDKATTTAIKEDIDNSSSRYTIIQKQILYSKKSAAVKKRDQAGLSKSVLDLNTLGEALPEFSRKKSCLMVKTKKGEGFLPPPNVHDIVRQLPAHANATSTSRVSEKGDDRQSTEETTVNTTSADNTHSLGDALDPQNACMWVVASSPAECTSYAGNTHSEVFSIWAATTSLLLLTSSLWLLKVVALVMTWVWNLI
ncbi:uncharacterized protein LOC130885010 [Chionomys nivalis]|uniref:uncharacterized protein LOC130885010 n=1 Tax=Chionomys nivalis TaxID=269649 RepID=UPI002596EE97|nr:uncharacterized protein LOC130885010 [Chionomys nivalis]